MLSIHFRSRPKRCRCRRCNRRGPAVDVLQGIDGSPDMFSSVLCTRCVRELFARVIQSVTPALEWPERVSL